MLSRTLLVLAATSLIANSCGTMVSNGNSSKATSITTVGGPMVHILNSTDGTEVSIQADRMQTTEDGQYRVVYATNVHVWVKNPQLPPSSAVRVVLIEDCHTVGISSSSFRREIQCDAQQLYDGFHAKVSDACHFDSGTSAIAMSSSAAGGHTTACTQEIAVVIDNQWLTDPVNGTHNFKFQF